MELFDKNVFIQHLGKEHSSLVEVFKSIGSTNDYLIEKARSGVAEGAIIISNSQTSGRGRTGKRFHSPEGGIYFSVLLRPDADNILMPYLTAVTALCLKQSIEEVFGVKTGVKWVNDVYIGNRKCAGILTESAVDLERGGYRYVIVGVGVNLMEPKGGYPDDVKDIATAINVEVEKGAERLVATTVNKLFSHYRAFDKGGFIREYRSALMLIGKKVKVLQGGENLGVATVMDIDDECRLKVQYDDGKIETLFYGEVSLCLNR